MIPEHLAEYVADLQHRQATRRQQRAELDATRAAGLRIRHRTKLAHLNREETMPTPPKPLPPPTADRSARVPRDKSRIYAEAPPRVQHVRGGYPGKPELGLADSVLRASLARLARDPDPEARRFGAQLAEQATKALLVLAERAEKASTAYKRLQADARRLGDQLDRRRTEIRNRTTVPKGQNA